MHSNKLLVRGITSWNFLSYLLVSLMLNQTHPYLFMLMMASLLLCLSMWMILFSLLIIPHFLQVLSNGYLQGFPLKILGCFITSWVLKFLPFHMGYCSLKASAFRIFFLVLEFLMLRKFTLLFPTALFYLSMIVQTFLMVLNTDKLLVAYGACLLPVPIFLLQSTNSHSSCINPPLPTGLLPNVFFVTWKVLSRMVSFYARTPHFISMPSLMLIGLGIKMIGCQLVPTLSSLNIIQFHGLLRSNALLLVHPLKQSMRQLLLLLLNFHGFDLYSWKSLSLFHNNPLYTVIMWGPHTCVSNPVFHSRIKHVEIDFHFVRDQVSNDNLCVSHVSSQDQLVDTLTKPLSCQ